VPDLVRIGHEEIHLAAGAELVAARAQRGVDRVLGVAVEERAVAGILRRFLARLRLEDPEAPVVRERRVGVGVVAYLRRRAG
jgi:hypothetical protein